MEHDEFGLRTSRRIRASDKRRETLAQVRYDVGRPPKECQVTVAEQRKVCTEGHPVSSEAQRQRQEGQQAQQQRKATARVTVKAGTSLTERMR